MKEREFITRISGKIIMSLWGSGSPPVIINCRAKCSTIAKISVPLTESRILLFVFLEGSINNVFACSRTLLLSLFRFIIYFFVTQKFQVVY